MEFRNIECTGGRADVINARVWLDRDNDQDDDEDDQRISFPSLLPKRGLYYRGTMDVEAALLVTSPTLSTISTTSTTTERALDDQNYPETPDSPSSETKPVLRKIRDDELTLTPRPTPRHPLPPRKPKFRIRPPYLMICISIIEISVHCLGDESTRIWLQYDPRQRFQGWRFASYMLLHAHALHLALNVVIQLVLATPLEVEQGRIAVATIYLGGGVCGALGASLLHPTLCLIGASAGVYALLTSHLAHLYLFFSYEYLKTLSTYGK